MFCCLQIGTLLLQNLDLCAPLMILCLLVSLVCFFCFVLCGWGFGDGLELGSLLSLGECSKTMEKTISYPEMSNLTYMKRCKKGVNYSISCVTGLFGGTDC